MRFVLDNDVDVAVRRLLTDSGHECWTAAEAGLAGRVAAEDDDISVYADDKDAVVITHDREFTKRRRRRTFGQHMLLRCEQPVAIDVLGLWLDDVVEALEQHASCVLEVSRTAGVKVYLPRWK